MGSEHIFHRTRGLTVFAALLVLALPAAFVVIEKPNDLGVLALVLVVGAVYCIFDYVLGQRLLLDDTAVTDRRIINSASVRIGREEVGSCQYKSVTLGKPPYFRVIEIQDTTGRKVIDVRRYGWGRQRRELFAALDAWITRAGVKVDDQTRTFLTDASK